MKKLWKIVAGLIVLGAAMLVTGCSHEVNNYRYDVYYAIFTETEAEDFENAEYIEDVVDLYENKYRTKDTYEHYQNISKAEFENLLRKWDYNSETLASISDKNKKSGKGYFIKYTYTDGNMDVIFYVVKF